MLNIPEEIKTLFKRDDIFKNFHVHFPNGEYTDLNNDDIVSESVEFTESLCSQQAFRFGLTEASEIKFTCVNVPNVRGAVIECAIEVQADSLGAEWLADNAPTGNEEFLDPQVCTYSDRNMYRVPYGRFIVDTCPRNHETMYKRDVTAYTERMDNAETLNPFQIAVMSAFYPEITTYSPYIKPLALSMLAKTEADILSNGYIKIAGTYRFSGVPNVPIKKVKTTSDETIDVVTTFEHAGRIIPTGSNASTALFTIDWGNFFERDIVQILADELEASPANIDVEASGYESFYALASDILGDFYMPGFLHSFDGETGKVAYMSIPKNTASIMYPYVAPVPTNEDFVAEYMRSVQVVVDGHPIHISGTAVTFGIFVESSADPINATPLNIGQTLQTTQKSVFGQVMKMYSFANAFSLSDIVQGYLELLCRFGSPSRAGGMEITALDNTSPVSILPENYAELWYDETTIAPIGYVQVKFKDETDNEQDLTVQIGTGASVYDLRDNAVLQNMVFTVSKAEAEAGVTIESKLLAFLNSVFTPNIPDLTFIPIELTKKGLPYLEAGDAVTITTGDGQVVPSFILRQTVKGIQFLTADVESANGEAVEMVET
jgi:hypothetical protein